MGRQLWIPQVCRQFGLTVVEVDGWQSRGSDVFNPQAVVGHHTAGAPTGEYPSLRTVRDGRQGLAGPLSNTGLGRSGTVFVVASGRANHAGVGHWRGLYVGNANSLGIEAENDGYQPWPAVQLRAYDVLVAALLFGIRRDAGWFCGHRESAEPHGRKPDPHDLDLNAMRTRVAKIRPGGAEPEVDVRGLDPAHAPRNVPWCMVKPNSREERVLSDLLAAATTATGPHALRGLPVVRVNVNDMAGTAPPGWSVAFGFGNWSHNYEAVAGPHWDNSPEGAGTARLIATRLGL